MWRLLIRYRRILIDLLHAAIVAGSIAAAFLLQFEFAIPKPELHHLTTAVWIAVAVKIAIFMLAGFDRGWWRYVGIGDVYTLLVGNFAASGAVRPGEPCGDGPVLPRSLYVIDFLICFFLTAGNALLRAPLLREHRQGAFARAQEMRADLRSGRGGRDAGARDPLQPRARLPRGGFPRRSAQEAARGLRGRARAGVRARRAAHRGALPPRRVAA